MNDYKFNMKYTFFYVVGGDDIYYEQLYRSIRSLSRLSTKNFKIKILDIDNKFNLETDFEIETISINKKLDSKELFWQYKYFICQQLDTEYGIYLDCDTVVCYDRLQDIENLVNKSFGVIPHFYIKDFDNFSKLFNNKNFSESPSDKFFTGGVFFFYNSIDNIKILQQIFNLHNQHDLNQSKGFYDETFLSYVLSDRHRVVLNGSFNHCSANYMPLGIKNFDLVGKNEFDNELEKIFVLHGSSKRQIEAEDFVGETKEKVKNFWKI